LEEVMAVVAEGTQGALVEREVLAPGTHIRVRMCRGRLPTRTGTIVDGHAFEGVTQGTVIAVCWDDDGSVSCIVPCMDIEVTGPI
jgi:hypothetical protein